MKQRSADLTERVVRYAADRLVTHDPGRAIFDIADEAVDVFVEVFPPLPRLIIVGAVHIAIPLVTFAKTLGFRTIVVDARSAFATRDRFPHTDELIIEWPATVMEKLRLDEATYIVIVTHDDKLDVPALQTALSSPARYIGILGSTTTHAKRIESLKQLGVTAEQLARIHAPIGLAVGAIGPQEIALSIMAEKDICFEPLILRYELIRYEGAGLVALCLWGNPFILHYLLWWLIQDLSPAISLYVWADMDYGGLNILPQLRQQVSPRFAPYRMDITTLKTREGINIRLGPINELDSPSSEIYTLSNST